MKTPWGGSQKEHNNNATKTTIRIMKRWSTMAVWFFCGWMMLAGLTGGFTPPFSTMNSREVGVVVVRPNGSNPLSTTSTQVFLFGGTPKDDGQPGDYVCKDCGYVFTKGPQAWAKLPDNYRCPPCGAPKFRFKKVPKGSAAGTKVQVKKSWF